MGRVRLTRGIERVSAPDARADESAAPEPHAADLDPEATVPVGQQAPERSDLAPFEHGAPARKEQQASRHDPQGAGIAFDTQGDVGHARRLRNQRAIAAGT